MTSSRDNPYWSVVAVSRNDNHGGDLLLRMQTFINCLCNQCNALNIPTELIIVEWNPPSERPPLAEVLDWSLLGEYVYSRVITVPPEIHYQFKHSEVLPVFQMIAKNVGVRRAKGDFVLATNIDILFSDELMRYIAAGKLKHGYHYRVDRVDVESSIMNLDDPWEIIKQSKRRIIRVNKRYGTYSNKKISDIPANVFDELKNHFIRARVWIDDGYPKVHTNACGDFALLSREDWEIVRGYPELEMYSFNIDSLILVTGYYLGIREWFLPRPKEIYHIEHGSGSGWTPGKGEEMLFGRLHKQGIPYLIWEDLLVYSRKLLHGFHPRDTSIGFCDENWGLQDLQLPELVISS